MEYLEFVKGYKEVFLNELVLVELVVYEFGLLKVSCVLS